VLGAYCETHGEGQEHEQYAPPSTLNVNIGASGGPFFSNASPSTATVTYQPAPLNLERLLPHDRLVVSGFPEGLGSCSLRFRLNQTPDRSAMRKSSPVIAILDTAEVSPAFSGLARLSRARESLIDNFTYCEVCLMSAYRYA